MRAYVTNSIGTGGGSLGGSSASPIAPDGSFLVQGLPGGMVNFIVDGVKTPYSSKGFVTLRIERDGVPVQRGI